MRAAPTDFSRASAVIRGKVSPTAACWFWCEVVWCGLVWFGVAEGGGQVRMRPDCRILADAAQTKKQNSGRPSFYSGEPASADRLRDSQG